MKPFFIVTTTTTRWSAAAALLCVSCSTAEFGSKTAVPGRTPPAVLVNPPSDDGKPAPFGTPVAPDLPTPGWATDQLKSDVDALINGKPGSPTDGGSNSSDAMLWLPCKPGEQSAGTFPSEYHGYGGTKVKVSGELCPSQTLVGDVTVMFVIDHSGSMEGAAGEGPNDPTSGGSCGRLRAAEAIVKKYQTMTNANVRVGVVGFSGIARVDVPTQDLAQFSSSLDDSVFCGADRFLASTNYEAAFGTATSALRNEQGKKVVYFISDGSPTVGGRDPRQAGLDAAKGLRQIGDLTLYALFVGYHGGNANNPQGYLESLTGDPGNVRVTSNADDLVKAADTLAQPNLTIDPKKMTVVLSTGNEVKPVAIEKFVERADAPGHFVWVTELFELKGDPSAPQLNTLTVTAPVGNGDTIETEAPITFHQFP